MTKAPLAGTSAAPAAPDQAPDPVEIYGIPGIPEISPGDDLAGLIADATILMAGVVAAAAVVAAVGGWIAMRLRAPERTLRTVRRAFERGDNVLH